MSTSERARLLSTPAADVAQVLTALRDLHRRFTSAVERYDGSADHAASPEEAMAEYAAFATDPRHEQPYADLVAAGSGDVLDLVDGLRDRAGRCAAVLEKYRALQLLDGHDGVTGHVEDVESCIEDESGAVAPTSASTVLLVGSGSLPMTLVDARLRTGARVAGSDIDPEAVLLGRRVLDHLARGGEPTSDIAVHEGPATRSPFTAEATHIVVSSTIAVKHELMDDLFTLARDDVVVAMRFGDGLTSLFDYPSRDVDPARWRLAGTVSRPGRVFDVALYEKSPAAPPLPHGTSA